MFPTNNGTEKDIPTTDEHQLIGYRVVLVRRIRELVFEPPSLCVAMFESITHLIQYLLPSSFILTVVPVRSITMRRISRLLHPSNDLSD